MVAEDDDDASKTEDASERKLEKAKEQGDTAISQEAKSFITFIGMLFVVWLIVPSMLKTFYSFSLKFIEDVATIPMDANHIQVILFESAFITLKMLSIPFVIFMVLGVFASIAQTGFIIATKKLEPDWSKLNVFAALPNFINMKKIVESLKGIIKIALVSVVCIIVITPYLKKVELMPTMSTIAILQLIHKMVIMLIFTIVIAVLALAIFDFAYQKYTHLKKMRMTKQEAKDEYKEMEGDPIIKSKIRQLRMEKAKQRMMENVPKADVVIVNPTHYAIALEYKMGQMDAPKVVAKGVDAVALRIKALAEENEVPIVENPPLARALFASTNLDEFVPLEHFKAVAEVIGYVMQLKNNQ